MREVHSFGTWVQQLKPDDLRSSCGLGKIIGGFSSKDLEDFWIWIEDEFLSKIEIFRYSSQHKIES